MDAAPPRKDPELLSSVKRAKALAAKYDIDKVHPNTYLGPSNEDWDELLNRLK